MRRIEFVAGYHEWNLYKNGKNIYSFSDFSDSLEEWTEEEAKATAFELAESVTDEDGRQILTENERQEASKAIFEAIKNYYL